MRRLVSLLACSLLLAVSAAAIAPAGLAKGPKPSAGDNQYIDPLTSTSPVGAAPSSKRKRATPTTTSAVTTQDTASLSPTPPANVPSTPSTTPAASSHTLPFTGLNVGAAIAVGLGLLLGGFALRRVATRPS